MNIGFNFNLFLYLRSIFENDQISLTDRFEIHIKILITMDLVKLATDTINEKRELPEFKAGDTVTVYYKIIEGNKERIQQYQGVVLQRKGVGASRTFTVRKISNGIGVERIFPLLSPKIDKIVVDKRGIVRRARIFYLRNISGKKARIEEKKS
jgi:large subunit ribosomal protein L19